MTIKRVKSALHYQQANAFYHDKRKDNLASAYLSAAMIALLFAGVVLLLGIALIDYQVGSYFDEKPMINIVLPPEI